MKHDLPTANVITKVRCRLLSDAGLVKLEEAMIKKIRDLTMSENFSEKTIIKGIRLIANASYVIGFLYGRTGTSEKEPELNLDDARKRFVNRWKEFDPNAN